jgi:hypothetical protein
MNVDVFHVNIMIHLSAENRGWTIGFNREIRANLVDRGRISVVKYNCILVNSKETPRSSIVPIGGDNLIIEFYRQMCRQDLETVPGGIWCCRFLEV